METKVCSCCGRELPITEFRKGVGNGTPFISHMCRTCVSEHQKMGHKRKKEEKESKKKSELEMVVKELEEKIEDVKKQRLSSFTPRELIERLRDLGYTGKLNYVETHVIDLENL